MLFPFCIDNKLVVLSNFKGRKCFTIPILNVWTNLTVTPTRYVIFNNRAINTIFTSSYCLRLHENTLNIFNTTNNWHDKVDYWKLYKMSVHWWKTWTTKTIVIWHVVRLNLHFFWNDSLHMQQFNKWSYNLLMLALFVKCWEKLGCVAKI